MKFGRNVFQVNTHRLTVGFSIWRHTFKMSTMTSFHTEKCCQLGSEHEASAGHLCINICQFLVYSRFVLV